MQSDIKYTANGLEAFETLKSYLEKEKWDFDEIEGKYTFKAVESGKTVSDATCFFQIRVDLEQFIFYLVPSFPVPSDKLQLAAEYVARVNSGMRIGNFEIDFRDGEIRFKSSINFAKETLTQNFIAGAINPALHAFDTYLPGLVNVIEGSQTPVRAINSIDYGV